jgi:dynein heavy chain 1
MGFGGSLLRTVKADLDKLLGACNATVKTTNDIKMLIQDLQTDAIPKGWRKYVVADITVTEWLLDFNLRLKQLQEVRACGNPQRFRLWLGGLFFPEAFLTASRQAVAQLLKLSLEELLLAVDVGCDQQDDESFIIKDLYLEGAAWDSQLTMTDELTVAMPVTRLKWVHRESPECKKRAEYLRVPVYLNTGRSNLVSEFSLPSPTEVPVSVWLQRSVCITLWTKQ